MALKIEGRGEGARMRVHLLKAWPGRAFHKLLSVEIGSFEISKWHYKMVRMERERER